MLFGKPCTSDVLVAEKIIAGRSDNPVDRMCDVRPLSRRTHYSYHNG